MHGHHAWIRGLHEIHIPHVALALHASLGVHSSVGSIESGKPLRYGNHCILQWFLWNGWNALNSSMNAMRTIDYSESMEAMQSMGHHAWPSCMRVKPDDHADSYT